VARRDKRIEAMRRNPRNVTIADLESVLFASGFELLPRRGKGDHRVYRHATGRQVGVDPRRPHVLPVYVKAVLAAIDAVAGEEQS
jgi:predicted RNA binding protein YcfA (HicA-like mRNA interferase family)